MTPPQETFYHPLNGTEHGSHPSLTTLHRELVSVLEVRIEPGEQLMVASTEATACATGAEIVPGRPTR